MWIAICCGAALITVTMGLRAGFGLFLAADLGRSRRAAKSLPCCGGAEPGLGRGLAVLRRPCRQYGAVRSHCRHGAHIAGLVLMAFTSGPFEVIAGNVLVGLALGAAGISTVIGSVSRMVPAEKRSIVLGILTAGGSIGQFVLVPVTQVFIDELGWSAAFIGLAIIACTMFPMIWGVREAPKASATSRGQTIRQALGDAFTHRGFWLLTIGFFVCGFHVVFVATHLPAYLGDKGMPAWLGASTLMLVGLCNIIGCYGAGGWGGRFQKTNVLTILSPALAGVPAVHPPADQHLHRAGLRRLARPAVAVDGSADQRPDRHGVRTGLYVHALWCGILLPSDRLLLRRLAWW
jgi:hypothetical protein